MRLRLRDLPALALLATLAACAAPQPGQQAVAPGCVPGPLPVLNASSQPVEQLYAGAPGAWGTDLLAGGLLEPRAVLDMPRPRPAIFTLRAVWADGRAAELPGLNACQLSGIEIADNGIRAQ
jgi:hypothetical protein